jgi:hypothetical protein
MKRLILNLAVALLILTRVQAANEPAENRVAYRYLIVLENSARMDRQRDAALDTIHQLILSGIQGRIRDGDVLGIWTFRDQLDRDRFRPITWSSGRVRDVANDVYRTLRDAGFAREPDLDVAMSGVTTAAQVTDDLTVFLVVTGTQRIRGTLFDTEINQIFEEHADAMRKSRRPFVTVLVMHQGRTVSHATNPAGRQLYIPPTPEPPAPAHADPDPDVAAPEAPTPAVEPKSAEPEPVKPQPAEPQVAEPPVAEPEIVEPAPKPRVLTVAEIERQLREAEEERIRRQAEAAALEQPTPPPSDQPPKPSVDPVEPEPDPVATTETKPTQPPASGPGFTERPTPREEPVAVPPTVAPETGRLVTPETTAEPGPGMMVPEAAAPRWRYLVTGVGLLLLAGLLSHYMYQRSRPQRARPSSISRSMDRR